MFEHTRRGGSLSFVLAALLLLGLPLAGCSRSGSDGNDGSPGASTGTYDGTVKNSLSGGEIPEATLETDPVVAGGSTKTDGDGKFTLDLPVGTYTVTCTAPDFTTSTKQVSVLADQKTNGDILLVPTAPVVVSAGSDLTGDPGESVSPVGVVKILDGSVLQSVKWEQTNSVEVVITGGNTLTPTVSLPSLVTYKAELIHHLKEPPITEDQLPPNIELPEGEFPGGLQNRFAVVGLNHFAIEEAGHVGLKLTVTTSKGTYTSEVDVHAHLPFKVATGLTCVPIGIPVLLHGRDQSDYDWKLVPPAGSSATLQDAMTQNPYFTPDKEGRYEVTVTEDTTNEAVTLEIFAGTWAGGITADSADGPVMGECLTCHATDKKFSSWQKSGHASIFSNNLDTSTHYGPNCFGCHTVGFDPDVANGGFDDASSYAGFLGASLLNNPGDNWETMLDPASGLLDAANLANIQCENCHGPNDGTSLHMDGFKGDKRASLSSDVCATCHGEPLRHARFQQWQLSPHANYELAIDEGDSGHCSRCHTGNGFLAWSKLNYDEGTRVTVTWETDEVHPQTCATCHDPHAQGSKSGEPNTASVRVSGDTPLLMAGFVARDVGRGAICMVCHNTRRGLKNDDAVMSMSDESPHYGAQADMMMGQNAFFVQTGVRGKHSLITDTCANCHMEKTPPPDLLAYKGGGTNHSFRASRGICSNCHDSINADELELRVEAEVAALAASLEAAIEAQIKAHLAAGAKVELVDRPRGGPTTVLAVLDKDDTIKVGNYSDDHQEVDVTVGAKTFAELAVDDILVDGEDFSDTTGEAQLIVKAGWNLLQVRIDGSHGIHNPDWAFRILAAAQNVLDLTDFSSLTTD